MTNRIVKYVEPNFAKPQQRREPKQLPVEIRWMIRRDMTQVLAIEESSFQIPWNENDFLSALKQRNCIGMVTEAGMSIVGFMVYELLAGELHLLNFAVSGGWRRKGVGFAMVERLAKKLGQQRRTRIVAEIRETNEPAQHFFRSCGFLATEVLRGYYLDTGEDAYRFVFEIDDGLGELIEA